VLRSPHVGLRLFASVRSGESYTPGLGEWPPAGVMAGWVAGDSAPFEHAGVDVGLTGEEDSPAAGVVVFAGLDGGVPEVAGEVAVCGCEELVEADLLLADEEHPGGLAAVEQCVASHHNRPMSTPPPMGAAP
jgi:hypothetical protein